MDQNLVEKTLAGDRGAFNLLLERHTREIYAHIAAKIRYATEVEDLVQETFLAAFAQLHQLKEKDRFSPWLKGIADNHIRMWYRRRYVQLRWQSMPSADADNHQVDHDPFEDSQIRLVLRTALSRLSSVQQEVLAYHYFKGYSYQETAKALDLRPNTVRSRLQKARTRLRKEMTNMADKALAPPKFTLDNEDLKALEWAGRFSSKDPKRPVLQGIYLDAGGKIVSTDGHRLYLRTLESLQALATPILLGPWQTDHSSQASSATLELAAKAANLKLADNTGYIIPIIEGPYVKYEQVIPPDGPIRASATAADLLETIEQILPQLEARHPENEECYYRPQVEIRLSPIEQTFSLLTTSNMGYNLHEPTNAPGEKPAAGAVWTFITSIQAQISSPAPKAPFRIAVNCASLKDALEALDLKPTAKIEISFTDQTTVIQFTPAANRQQKTLLMPMRLAPPN